MPNSGAFKLGDILGGGLELPREQAFIAGQKAESEMSHLSAQTEEAIANAKVKQMEARKRKREQDIQDNLADDFFTLGVVDTPEKARAAANIVNGGAANFEQFTGGQGHMQTQGFERTLADDLLPEGQRLAASSALTHKVQASPEGGTPAVANYKFSTTLKTPQEQANFDKFAAPDKVTTVGGVPYLVPRGGSTPRQVVSRDEAAANAAAIAGAKTQAQGEAKITVDKPAAQARLASASAKLDSVDQLVDKIVKDPDVTSAVGLAKPLGSIWGTGPRNVRANLGVLRNKIALGTLTELRQASKTGGALGNVSNADISLLKDSIAAIDDTLSAEDLIDQLHTVQSYVRDLKDRMHEGFNTQYPQSAPAAGQPAPAAGGVVKWTRDANGNPVRAQ